VLLCSGDRSRTSVSGPIENSLHFRHTFAKRALEKGRRITWLSRHLGRGSVTVPLNVLGEYQYAVRDAFGGHGGYEVDNAGDGFFYAFSTAGDAARAVGEALAALAGGPVRIRVTPNLELALELLDACS
jgi:hypothetical protein